ncbi:MAG: ABC transporter substrate-binding protein [Cohaesibacter sp.]|nr:ABC transporter substrate-binding protein [Cohaesibacter sp.]
MSISGNLSRRAALGLTVGAALSVAAPFEALVASANPHPPMLPQALTRDCIKNQSLPKFKGHHPKVILGDGHLLLALALILDDPVAHLHGWQADLIRHSPQLYDLWRQKAPALAEVPRIGDASAASFSLETTLALEPDLVILGGGYGPGLHDTHIITKLKQAGIPILFVDFYHNPLEHSADSLRALGRIFGATAFERANHLASLIEQRIQTIKTRLAKANPPRPKVLLEGNAGLPGMGCCWLPGGKGLGSFIELAGGINPGTELSSSRAWVKMARELVLQQQPDVYICTGGPYLRGKNGLAIGPGIEEDEARRSLGLAAAASQTVIASQMQPNSIHGLWHLFPTSPLNIIALEALCTWLHPSLFAKDPEQISMEKLNKDFLSLPMPGCYSVSLQS